MRMSITIKTIERNLNLLLHRHIEEQNKLKNGGIKNVKENFKFGKRIDHQMEQYRKNGINENLFNTVCEIYDVDNSTYITK